MKFSKVFSALALAIVFSLLIWIIPAAPGTSAATAISVSPTSGPTTTSLTVSGTGFTAGNTVLVYFPDTTTWKTNAVVTGACTFSAPSFTVGEYPAGSKTVWVNAGGTWYSSPFVVTPDISLNPTTDYVDQEVVISGTGFAASKNVTVTFYTSVTGYVTAGTASTNANGSFSSATFTVPESYRGSHTVKAVDGSSNSDTASFTTKQSIAISPTSGAVGDEVTVTGTGFGANKYMNITYAGGAITISPPPKTGANGSFSAKFNVPSCVNGTYEVKAKEGTTTYVGTANFVVSAGASLSKTTGNVGTSLTVTGTGFVVNATVTVTYDGVQVATTTVSAGGTFSAFFNVPVSTGGNHTITVTDNAGNTETLTFTMESTPPSTPTPLLPEMGVKTKSQTEFDWEDVTDPSPPVTYTLQIATDADFTATSTVLTKEDITTSAYTLTKEEKLESTKEEAPYYWRIKAIDGASNESGWSGAGTFYVSGFSFGGWFKYVLYVLGGLALVAIGFWLGRRIAYY